MGPPWGDFCQITLTSCYYYYYYHHHHHHHCAGLPWEAALCVLPRLYVCSLPTTKLQTEDVRSEVTQVSGRAFLRSQGVKGHDQWSKVVTGAEMWKSLLGHIFMKNVSTHIKWIPRWHPIPRCTFCLHGVSKKTGSLFKQSVKNRIRSVHTKNN